jgi:hypothetical protein
VVTSIAAEGMHLVDGENALIADDPPAFIAAVRRLYNSEALWTKLSANGLKNVQEHFSFESASREIDRLLDDVGFDLPGPRRTIMTHPPAPHSVVPRTRNRNVTGSARSPGGST